MRGEENLKSAQRRPKRQRPRISEDEDINFDASARLCENVLSERSKNSKKEEKII